MPFRRNKAKRYSGLKLHGQIKDEQVDLLVRLEYAKWPHLLVAMAFGILAFLSALLHVDDQRGVHLEFSNWFTARGGLALAFIVLAGWTVYWSRSDVVVGDHPKSD